MAARSYLHVSARAPAVMVFGAQADVEEFVWRVTLRPLYDDGGASQVSLFYSQAAASACAAEELTRRGGGWCAKVAMGRLVPAGDELIFEALHAQHARRGVQQTAAPPAIRARTQVARRRGTLAGGAG